MIMRSMCVVAVVVAATFCVWLNFKSRIVVHIIAMKFPKLAENCWAASSYKCRRKNMCYAWNLRGPLGNLAIELTTLTTEWLNFRVVPHIHNLTIQHRALNGEWKIHLVGNCIAKVKDIACISVALLYTEYDIVVLYVCALDRRVLCVCRNFVYTVGTGSWHAGLCQKWQVLKNDEFMGRRRVYRSFIRSFVLWDVFLISCYVWMEGNDVWYCHTFCWIWNCALLSFNVWSNEILLSNSTE